MTVLAYEEEEIHTRIGKKGAEQEYCKLTDLEKKENEFFFTRQNRRLSVRTKCC